ncbi:MAG: chemotaxis protein CheC [Dehalococcoidia bacterium]
MVEQHTGLDESLRACSELVSQGSINAVSGLSQMIGQDISVTSISTRRIPANETPDLIGGWEQLTLGVYLAVSGDAEGHMFLVYEPKTAMALADLLMGDPPGTTQSLDEMEASALGEVGNVMGSFFLNSLADNTNSQFQPSPPAVMMDMAGAILNVALANILQESDDALVVETSFSTDDQQINGTLLVMPSPDLLRVMLEHLQNDN